MADPQRSGCPINLTLEALGDRWSLIVIRDIMFGNRRHFRELLKQSDEGIASNILADRLKRLTDGGFLTRAGDPDHKQKAVYSLTEKSIQLVPLMAMMGAWGVAHTSTTRPLAIRATLLERGGPQVWAALMDDLRAVHLDGGEPRSEVVEGLRRAYEAELEREHSGDEA